jgi:hypothetical protein
MADDLFSLPAPNEATTPKLDLKPIDRLKEGWEFVKPHYLSLALVIIASIVINFVLAHVPFGFLLSFIVHITVNSGIIYYLVSAYRGDKPALGAVLLPIQKKPLEMVVIGLLYPIIVVVGLVLLILPGLYFAIAFAFAWPLVVLTGTGATDALKLSQKLVQRQLGDFIVFWLVVVVINFLAAIPFGLGLLVTVPATAGAATILTAQLLGIPRTA